MTDILELIEDDDSTETIEIDDSDFEDSSSEIVRGEGELSEDKARELTNAIKAAAEATYVLLARAHQGKAYKALGYSTWADYVTQEFEISTQRSYQLLNLSKTIEALEAVAPEGTEVKLTEAQARDIKRELPFITSKIAEETKDLTPEEASDRIDETIQAAREQKKADDEAIALKEKNLAEAEADGFSKGLEAGADALLESNGFDVTAGVDRDDDDEDNGWGSDSDDSTPGMSPQFIMDFQNLANMLMGAKSLPDPQEFVDGIPEGRWEDVKKQAQDAEDWFHRFNELAANRD